MTAENYVGRPRTLEEATLAFAVENPDFLDNAALSLWTEENLCRREAPPESEWRGWHDLTDAARQEYRDRALSMMRADAEAAQP